MQMLKQQFTKHLIGTRPNIRTPPKSGFSETLIKIKKIMFYTPMTMKDFTIRMEIGAGIVLLGLIIIIVALLI